MKIGYLILLLLYLLAVPALSFMWAKEYVRISVSEEMEKTWIERHKERRELARLWKDRNNAYRELSRVNRNREAERNAHRQE